MAPEDGAVKKSALHSSICNDMELAIGIGDFEGFDTLSVMISIFSYRSHRLLTTSLSFQVDFVRSFKGHPESMGNCCDQD